jgi:predicted amidohydrolase
LKLATVQMPMASTMAENTRTVMESLVEARALGADVAVFPECATVGFHRGMGEGVSRESVAEVVSQLCRRCAELRINAVVGTPYYGTPTQEKPWNAVLAIDDSGRQIAVSPKIQFSTGEVRHNIMEPAAMSSRRTFRLAGRTWAALICCELSGEPGDEKEYYREYLPLLDATPEIVFVPGLLAIDDDAAAFPYTIDLAKEYQAYVVVANWPHWLLPPVDGMGRSLIVTPSGDILCEATKNEPAITLATLF